MPRIGRRAFTAGGLSLAACASQPPPTDAPTASAMPEPPPSGAPFTPIVGLSGVNPVLWSWTTSGQIDELSAGAPLFSRATSDTAGPGFLFDLLDRHARGVVADLRARLRLGRFAWFNPWATSRGLDGESYGDELLRIVVAPDALFLVLQSSSLIDSEGVSSCDVAGNRVPLEVVEAAPDRVVGVYLTHDRAIANACRGTRSGGGASPYREIYLGNEARIATWSARGDLVARDIARFDADLLRLARRPYSDGSDFCAWSRAVVQDSWTTHPTSDVARYLSSLAFPTSDYVPTRDNLGALRATLAAVPLRPPGLAR